MQRVEKCERELSDVNIHLQVAIKAAREAEAERSTARELIARQGAQLEAASKEREFLQQINRTMQASLWLFYSLNKGFLLIIILFYKLLLFF